MYGNFEGSKAHYQCSHALQGNSMLYKNNINKLKQYTEVHNYNTYWRSDLHCQFCRTNVLTKKKV